MPQNSRINPVILIIAINAIIFLVIRTLLYYNPSQVAFFVLNPVDALSGKYLFSLITSIFAHAEIWHLIMNMLSLVFIGGFLQRLIGRKRFFWLYLLSGVFANIFFVFMTLVLQENLNVNALGASGAIFGIAGTLMIITPKLPVYLMFIPIPMPLWFGIIFLLVFLWLFSAIAAVPIGNLAHLGGLLAGVVYGVYLRRRYKRKIKIVNKLLGLG